VADISNEKKGIHTILKLSSVYNAVQKLLGSKRSTKYLTDMFIQPKSGDSILDFGSGTGYLFNSLNLVDGIAYTGVEPNASYVSTCKVNFRNFSNANFYTGSIETVESIDEEFDLIIVFAVLHHLDLDSWPVIIDSLHGKLKKSGRLLLLDNILHDGQGFISKTLVKFDRGQSILHEKDYREVLIRSGHRFETTIKTDLLNLPYSHILTTIYK
jgi:SAM-dependent methyltransferase